MNLVSILLVIVILLVIASCYLYIQVKTTKLRLSTVETLSAQACRSSDLALTKKTLVQLAKGEVIEAKNQLSESNQEFLNQKFEDVNVLHQRIADMQKEHAAMQSLVEDVANTQRQLTEIISQQQSFCQALENRLPQNSFSDRTMGDRDSQAGEQGKESFPLWLENVKQRPFVQTPKEGGSCGKTILDISDYQSEEDESDIEEDECL